MLPGRVFADPPSTRRFVTPSIFVEQTRDRFRIDEVVVLFPVWIVVDGTVEAQIGGDAALTWNTFLAVYPFATADRRRRIARRLPRDRRRGRGARGRRTVCWPPPPSVALHLHRKETGTWQQRKRSWGPAR